MKKPKTYFVYALEFAAHTECFAIFGEKSRDSKHCFLFECPEEWLPENAELFRKACEHHKITLKQPASWFGHVPY